MSHNNTEAYEVVQTLKLSSSIVVVFTATMPVQSDNTIKWKPGRDTRKPTQMLLKP